MDGDSNYEHAYQIEDILDQAAADGDWDMYDQATESLNKFLEEKEKSNDKR